MIGECPTCKEHPMDCKCDKKKTTNEDSKYKEFPCGMDHLQPGTRKYKRGICTILVSPPFAKLGWHLSISTGYRDPTWEEIRDAWYDLVPNADNRNAAMFFTPKEEYINMQKYCFHVHEMCLDLKTASEVISVT